LLAPLRCLFQPPEVAGNLGFLVAQFKPPPWTGDVRQDGVDFVKLPGYPGSVYVVLSNLHGVVVLLVGIPPAV
jgi:hypothetical protein